MTVQKCCLTLGWDTIGWDNISPDVQILGIDLSPVGEFPVPVQSCGWLFFSYGSQSSYQNATFCFQKLLQNDFCLENGANMY